ncbi:MAG: hypothetical protein BWY59_00352 [Verrucomicrobia bacterium ADurb.Bin345]|nr:MAG: hypothetical protein BWY59_00352 [Verrucomicrobia bacterium ADurb.Bin345]
MDTSPSCSAKTCGRSIEVSVMPSRRTRFASGSVAAMMKNHGPSGEPRTCTRWIARYTFFFSSGSLSKSSSVVGAIASIAYSSG